MLMACWVICSVYICIAVRVSGWQFFTCTKTHTAVYQFPLLQNCLIFICWLRLLASGRIHSFCATRHAQTSPTASPVLLSPSQATRGYNCPMYMSGVWIKTLRISFVLVQTGPACKEHFVYMNLQFGYLSYGHFTFHVWIVGDPDISYVPFSIMTSSRR